MRSYPSILFFLALTNCLPYSLSAQWQSVNTPLWIDSGNDCSLTNTMGDIASDSTIYWVHNYSCGWVWINQHIDIYKSTNSGINWSECYALSGEYTALKRIYFISGDTGFIVIKEDPDNIQDEVYRTPNGMGSMHFSKYQGWPFAIIKGLKMISFDEMYGIMYDCFSLNEYVFMRLQNDTFNVIYSFPSSLVFSHATIEITPNQTIFITGISSQTSTPNRDIILRSTDFGQSWDTSFLDTTFSITSLRFSSDNIGIGVGKWGQIIKTENAGESWKEQSTPTNANLRSIDYLDDSTWMAVGTSGLLLMTSDGGDYWKIKDSPTMSNLLKVKIPDKDEFAFILTSDSIWKASINQLIQVVSDVNFEDHFQIYPNPVRDSFTLSCNSELFGNSAVNMYDIYGKKVFHSILRQKHEIINCENLAQGIYIIVASNQKVAVSHKIVVQ